ncbi:MAG: hypothetical protein F6K47_29640 [Symploca sp. SIO2E6]|nr:hypothetical protein [Symploca sp. SIO2E6]
MGIGNWELGTELFIPNHYSLLITHYLLLITLEKHRGRRLRGSEAPRRGRRKEVPRR